MRVVIDQGGKIEQMGYDSVVAAVRGKVSSIVIIDRKVKRTILSMTLTI